MMKRFFTSLLVVLSALMAIPMNAAEITYDFVAARGALDADVTITASGTSAGTNGMGTALVYPNELGDLFKGNFGFFFRGECTVKLTSEGLVMAGSKDTYISVLNLKEGDKVTVYYTGSVLFCDNPVTNIEGITSQWTACESGTTYTLTADGNFNVQWKKSKTVITKITVETTATETVSAPGIAVTGVSGINRTVTITPGLGSLGSAVNTYYTINGDDPTNTSEAYTTPFTLSETATVKAVSMLANGTSSPITSLEVAAGESIKLIANATLTDITEAGSSYAFSVTNTNLIGTPTVTFSYTYGDIKGEGATYTAAGAGKLSVIASAEGYESSDALETTVYEYEVGESLSLKDANVLAEDDAAWTYNSEGTRYANWSGYNGVSKAPYPYWTPAANGQGTIGNFTFEPSENVLMRTIGFIHNSGTQNLSIVGLPENATAKFVVSTYLSNPFNVFVDATEGTATYGIGAGNTGYAVEAVQLYTKKVPAFDPATAIVNADFTADEPIAQKVCTYAKDVQEGQVAQMQPLTGWTIVENGDARAAGTFAYGSTAILGGDGGNVPAVGPNGETEGKLLGIEAVWSATTQYTQEITLPAGDYLFEAVIYNAAGTGALSQNLIGIDGTYCTTKNYPVGKWTKDQVKITLAEEKTVTVSLGVNSGNVGNGAAPHLFIDHVKLYGSEEIAAIELAAAKENALTEVDALTIGDVLFTYPEAAISSAKAAIESATTVEAVDAAVVTAKAALNKPAADKAYAIANTTATGNLCITTEKVSVAKDASVFFTEVEGGYVLSNEAGEYILKTAGNTWTLSTTTTKEEAYVVNFNLADGAYTIQGANGLFGLDSTDEGSTVYANKAQSNNGLWTIAEYVAPVKTDYTDYIVNADLKGEGGFDATGTKGIDGSGIVKAANNAQFDFKQTIANLPAGKYKVTAQAAYRYSGSEADEAAAIDGGTDTKFAKLYATVGTTTVDTLVMNRWDGASDTDYANGNGSVTVNEKFVPNSSDAVKAWFAAGQYVNEVIFNLPADGAVTIGIVKTAQPEAGDYTVIGPWMLTRLGDAEVEPEPEPIEGIIYSWESPEGTPVEFGGTIAYVNGDGDRLNYKNGDYYTICLNGKKADINAETASANAGKMVITLDEALNSGDTIVYTAYINKNASATAAAYILFENGAEANGADFSDAANINEAFGGTPQNDTIIVSEAAAGSKTITLTRGKTGTNLFITKFQIIEKKAEPEPEPTFFEFNGVAYIIDAETGKFVAAGHDYGTRGIISEIGLDLTFTANAETKMVTIDTKVKNTDTDHFLGSNLYMDAPAAEWGLLEQEFGFYITDGTKYLSIDANDNLALSEEPRLWILVTPEGVKDQILDDMKEASVEKPMDVTALIKANNFNRNDQRNAEAWTVSADCTNKNLSGGNGVNNCVESFHSTFTISQAIEGAPKGVYALTAQGFYRQDGSDNDHLPVFFANEETKTFPVKSGSENSMSDASGSFTNGLYTIDPIFVQVAEAGTLTVGAKLEGNTALWCIWDNFQLTYYGADADIDAVKNAAIIKELADLRAKALGLKEQIDVEAVKNAIDEAIATTADVTGAEAINTAIATMKAVIEKAEFYLTAKTALASMENVMAGTNVYTAEAFQTYNGIYEAAKGKYEAGELTAEDKLENPESLLGWHVANNVDDLLLSAWTIGETQCKDYDAGMYINTWSVEGENDGSNFKVPFFEYWTADANSLAENTLTATMTNLPEGKYDVTAWVRVRAKNGYTAPAYGITLSANEGEAVDVAAGDQVGTSQMYLKEFTAIGEVAADGVLKIQFKVAADNNISWLSFKNVKYAFNETATGIHNINAEKTAGKGIYNLNGQKVTKAQKGLFIIGGKKVVK